MAETLVIRHGSRFLPITSEDGFGEWEPQPEPPPDPDPPPPDPPPDPGGNVFNPGNPIETTHDTIPAFAHAGNVNVKSIVANGNWSNPLSWSTGQVPQPGQVVGICVAHHIVADVMLTASTAVQAIGVQGILSHPLNANSRLWTQNLQVFSGGVYRIGTPAVGVAANPVQPHVVAELVITDAAVTDPTQWGNMVGTFPGGKFIACGSFKTPFVRLAGDANQGMSTLTLASAPVGWRVGDTVTVADSRQYNSTIANESDPNFNHLDHRTIAAISGTTLTLSSALSHIHPPARDYQNNVRFRPHVINRTRNVVIRSATNSSTYGQRRRGHMVWFGPHHDEDTDPGWCDHTSVEARDLGRTHIGTFHTVENRQGRYGGWHWHHVGNGPAGGVRDEEGELWSAWLENSVAHTTGEHASAYNESRYGVTMHGTNRARVKGNVVYGHTGSHIWTEATTEVGNLIDGNFCCFCRGTHDRGDIRFTNENSFDGGHEGSCYWEANTSNPPNRFRNNIANFATIYGYAQFNKFNIPDIPPWTGHDGNEAYGQIEIAVTVWYIGTFTVNYYTPPQGTSYNRNFKAWHVKKCLYGYPSLYFTLENWECYGDATQLSGEGAMGLYYGDYLTAFHTVRNSRFENFTLGHFFPPKQGDNSNIGISPHTTFHTPQTTRFENCIFRCLINMHVETPWGVTGGGGSLSPRRLELVDCTLGSPYGYGSVDIRYIHLADGNNNWIYKNEILVYNPNGSGVNYKYYAPMQEPGYITPMTGSSSSGSGLGAPEANQTNAQNLAEHGVCYYGELTPAGAVAHSTTNGKRIVF